MSDMSHILINVDLAENLIPRSCLKVNRTVWRLKADIFGGRSCALWDSCGIPAGWESVSLLYMTLTGQGKKFIGNLEDRNKEAVRLLRLLVSHC